MHDFAVGDEVEAIRYQYEGRKGTIEGFDRTYRVGGQETYALIKFENSYGNHGKWFDTIKHTDFSYLSRWVNNRRESKQISAMSKGELRHAIEELQGNKDHPQASKIISLQKALAKKG